MTSFFYLDRKDSCPLMVQATSKPSQKTGRTYTVNEWDSERAIWRMPVFPEISGRQLSKMKYIGKVEHES